MPLAQLFKEAPNYRIIRISKILSLASGAPDKTQPVSVIESSVRMTGWAAVLRDRWLLNRQIGHDWIMIGERRFIVV